jgi:hypothetical protein
VFPFRHRAFVICFWFAQGRTAVRPYEMNWALLLG